MLWVNFPRPRRRHERKTAFYWRSKKKKIRGGWWWVKGCTELVKEEALVKKRSRKEASFSHLEAATVRRSDEPRPLNASPALNDTQKAGGEHRVFLYNIVTWDVNETGLFCFLSEKQEENLTPDLHLNAPRVQLQFKYYV